MGQAWDEAEMEETEFQKLMEKEYKRMMDEINGEP